MTEPSLDKIIEQLQFCIGDAKAMQLKMLERILSKHYFKPMKIKTNPTTTTALASTRAVEA